MKLSGVMIPLFALSSQATRQSVCLANSSASTDSSDANCVDRAIVASRVYDCFEHSKCAIVFNIFHTCFGSWDPPLAPIYDMATFNSYFGCVCEDKTLTPPSHPWYYCAACVKQLGQDLNLKRSEFIPMYHASGARNLFCVWNQDVSSLRDLITNFTLAADFLGPFVNSSASLSTMGTSPTTSIAVTTSLYPVSKPTDPSKPTDAHPSIQQTGAPTYTLTAAAPESTKHPEANSAPSHPANSQHGSWFTNAADAGRRHPAGFAGALVRGPRELVGCLVAQVPTRHELVGICIAAAVPFVVVFLDCFLKALWQKLQQSRGDIRTLHPG